MFLDLFIDLRTRGVPASLTELLTFHEALGRGLVTDLDSLYAVGRATLVKSEAHYDAFDQSFLQVFRGIETPVEVRDELREWLENPVAFPGLSPDAIQQLTGLSMEELRERFEEMLREQKERHDGGSRYVGTGGRSPFGSGGVNPAGVRLGPGGGRTAVQVAEDRRFRNYRTDVTLDVRQFKVALKGLRRLTREGEEELDLDGTIDKTCRNAGDIDLVYERSRRNRVRLVLMMDAGGSMSPYAELVSRLFTAAHESSHFREFDYYYFHNCVYGTVYKDIHSRERIATERLLAKHPQDAKLIMVGDACMAPWELSAAGGAIYYYEQNRTPGIEWLRRLRHHFTHRIWLNPEPEGYWNHPTIRAIGHVFDMFPLTVDGLNRAVKKLKVVR